METVKQVGLWGSPMVTTTEPSSCGFITSQFVNTFAHLVWIWQNRKRKLEFSLSIPTPIWQETPGLTPIWVFDSVISKMTSLCISVLLCHASTWTRPQNYPWIMWERERRKHHWSAGPVILSWACLSWALVKCCLAASWWVWNHTNSLTWSILVVIWSQANAKMKKLETWPTLYHKDCNCCLSFCKMSSLQKYSIE